MTNKKTCEIDGCELITKARGRCPYHYKEWRMRGKECSWTDCHNMPHSLNVGLCSTHHSRQRRGGDMNAPMRPIYRNTQPRPERLDDYVGWERWLLHRTRNDGDCLVLEGVGYRQKGYVTLKVKGKAIRAHRLMAACKYAKPVDELDTVHHSCHNRGCIRSEHLFEVTQYENTIEMFEREAYLKRINRLEAENAQLKERLEVMTNGTNAATTRSGW